MEGISANLLEQLDFKWKVINEDSALSILLLNFLAVFASLVWLLSWPGPLKAAVY